MAEIARYADALQFTDDGDRQEVEKLTYCERVALICENDITKRERIENMKAVEVHKWCLAIARLNQRREERDTQARENAEQDRADLEMFG